MSDITILIVEDDYLNRRLVKKVLQERGYKILEAKSGDEAVTQLLNNRIDLFILDIKLGVHDREGIGLGTFLKGRYAIPFIYLTAYQTHEVLNDALATSPHSYLTKPFRNTDLIASVELALQKSAEREKNLPYVVLKVEAFTVKLPLERIDYIESEGNYLLVYSNNKVYRSRGTIKQILVSLPADTFLQTHRAFIVNKNKIDRFSAKSLMIKRHSIPVSKNYIPDIQAIYGVADW
jgi:DNA-binding LytR/AlgR family response regulator